MRKSVEEINEQGSVAGGMLSNYLTYMTLESPDEKREYKQKNTLEEILTGKFSKLYKKPQ